VEIQTVEGRQAVSGYLTELWEKILGRKVDPEADFFELGGSSLGGIKMIMEVQSTYNIDLDIETFFEDPSVANLTAIVLRNIEQGASRPGGRAA